MHELYEYVQEKYVEKLTLMKIDEDAVESGRPAIRPPKQRKGTPAPNMVSNCHR